METTRELIQVHKTGGIDVRVSKETPGDYYVAEGCDDEGEPLFAYGSFHAIGAGDAIALANIYKAGLRHGKAVGMATEQAEFRKSIGI